MKTKLTGSLAVVLTLTMIGYMSVSLKSANAQSGKTSTPAKSEPAKNPTSQVTGAGAASLAPAGSGASTLQNVTTPVEAEEIVEESGCCSRSGK